MWNKTKNKKQIIKQKKMKTDSERESKMTSARGEGCGKIGKKGEGE